MSGYHYVITLQFETWNGVQTVAYETGVIFPDPGETRGNLFRRIFGGAKQRLGYGGSTNPVPLCFTLERDKLEEVAR